MKWLLEKYKERMLTVTDIPNELEVLLKELQFPASQLQILIYAGKQGASREAMAAMQRLPVQQYKNMKEIRDGLEAAASPAGWISDMEWNENRKGNKTMANKKNRMVPIILAAAMGLGALASRRRNGKSSTRSRTR